MTIVLKGPDGVKRLNGPELSSYWFELAVFLNGKMDPVTRKLPPAYESAYATVQREFARRGVQLALF